MQRIKTATIFSNSPGKRLFVLMLVVTVTITIDSEIGYVADFIPEQISSNTGVFVFILIAVIFVVTQYLILDYVKHLYKETRQRVPHLSKLHSGVFVTQYLLVGVIVVVILQILFMQQYNIIPLYIVYAISYGLWIVTRTKLKESNNIRESDILINELDTLDSVLGRLMDLKYGKKTKAIEISEANQDFGEQLDYENRLIKSKILKMKLAPPMFNY